MQKISHSTEQEKAFLDRLGSYCVTHGLSRRDLLQGYISGAHRRVKWEAMSRAAVLNYAGQLYVAAGG